MINRDSMILQRHPDSPRGRQKAIGYWSENIKPQNFVDESWDTNQRDDVISYLNSTRAETLHRWRGYSSCRFCDKRNGSTCLTDGTYAWPSGFAHYLEEHGVKPDMEFIRHILPAVPASVSTPSFATKIGKREVLLVVETSYHYYIDDASSDEDAKEQAIELLDSGAPDQNPHSGWIKVLRSEVTEIRPR